MIELLQVKVGWALKSIPGDRNASALVSVSENDAQSKSLRASLQNDLSGEFLIKT